MTQTPAGWYPDPYGTPQLRWWDGTQWTDATHPLERPSGQGGPVTTGQWAQPGAVPQPQPGTAPHPSPGTVPAPGPGTPQPGGTASHPAPGAGQEHTRQGPPPGTGPDPRQGTPPYAPPGGPQGTGPYGGPAPQQWGAQPGGTAQFPVPEFGSQGPPPKKNGALPWVLGGGAVAVLLVIALVVGLGLVNRNGTQPVAATPLPTVEPSDPQITPPLEATPAPSPGPSSPTDLPAELPAPENNMITDRRTGLSYTFPGGPWKVPTWSELNGNGPADPRFPQWTSGYQAVSQKNYDGQGNNWVSQVTAARLPEIFDYDGPKDLRNTTGELLIAYEKLYYSPRHKRKIVKDAALEVGGKKAWLLRFEMDFTAQAKKSGWKFKKEEGYFLVVDQGSGQRPILMYASVPDNLDTSLIDRVLGSLTTS